MSMHAVSNPLTMRRYDQYSTLATNTNTNTLLLLYQYQYSTLATRRGHMRHPQIIGGGELNNWGKNWIFRQSNDAPSNELNRTI
eukprot:1192893-Prorocentrum_minimum.AAC.1